MIVDRVRKLLALSRDSGATESEASAAAAKAAGLMMAHNISERDVERSGSRVTRGDTLRGDAYRRWLRWSSAVLMNVGVLQVSEDSFVFVGRAENVCGAQDTFDMLVAAVERLYKLGLPTGMTQRQRAEWRRSWKDACARRVYSRACGVVAERRLGLPSVGASGALVVQMESTLRGEVDEFFDAMGIRTKTRAVKASCGSGTSAGWAAGESVELQRRV